MRFPRLAQVGNAALLLLSLHNNVANADGLRGRNDYPTCGDCWCIPSPQDTCPYWEPTEYSKSVRKNLHKQIPVNSYRLNCDPYTLSNCTTTPPQEFVDEESAVCALIYDEPKHRFSDCDKYRMFTYLNHTLAEADGAFVTHEGACGVCSTTMDLAAMMDPKFEAKAIQCLLDSVLGNKVGMECYLELGLTPSCAKIHIAEAVYSSSTCAGICAAEKAIYDPDPVPMNGPAPTCMKNGCLLCIENEASAVFTKFAGRTKKRSGLLSTVVRHCYGFAEINHEVCPGYDANSNIINIFEAEE